MKSHYCIVSTDYWSDAKTMALRAKFGMIAELYPIRLWSWAHSHAQSGNLSGLSPGVIEGIAGWDGTPGELHAALTETGFIRPDGTLAGWEKYTGHHLTQWNRRKELKVLDTTVRRGKVMTKGKPALFLASLYLRHNPGELTVPGAARMCRAALDNGAMFKDLEEKMQRSKGRRLEDVLSLKDHLKDYGQEAMEEFKKEGGNHEP